MISDFDFINRSDWAQSILQGLPDFLHVLSVDGRILNVSNSCWSITGYNTDQLLGCSINDFIHPDDIGVFIQEFNASLLHFKRTRFTYRFRKNDGSWVILESQCRPYLRQKLALNSSTQSDSRWLNLIIMARPYLSKERTLFDSFLEQQVEHERLTRLAEKLRQERLEDFGGARFMAAPRQGTESKEAFESLANPSNQHISFETASMNETDAISVASSHLYDTAAMPSTEDTNSSMIGDVGIPIARTKKPRKTPIRTKRQEDHAPEVKVCISCGTSSSPEWRKGPMGPKTLCNACGRKCIPCTFLNQ